MNGVPKGRIYIYASDIQDMRGITYDGARKIIRHVCTKLGVKPRKCITIGEFIQIHGGNYQEIENYINRR